MLQGIYFCEFSIIISYPSKCSSKRFLCFRGVAWCPSEEGFHPNGVPLFARQELRKSETAVKQEKDQWRDQAMANKQEIEKLRSEDQLMCYNLW